MEPLKLMYIALLEQAAIQDLLLEHNGSTFSPLLLETEKNILKVTPR